MTFKRICFTIGICLPAVLHAQDIRMYDEHGNLGLRFPSETGYTYKLSASEDLVSWHHLVSLRNPAQVDWPLRESESTRQRMFFRAEKVVATGLENLTGWQAFQSAEDGGRFHIGLIGDSFTHARDRYAKRLKQTLTGEYGNLGAGYLGFAFVTGAGNNGSVDETELNYVINPSEWTVTYGNGYGADACHVTSAVTGARIDVRVLKRVDKMKIHYAHQPGSGGFRYRVKEGDWTIVITDAPLGLGIESLDLASQDAPYDVEIELLREEWRF